MIETPKAYSRRQLISVAEVASTLATGRNIAGLEAVQQLAEAVRVGMLCPDLYPPHQQWQHGGDSERIGKPSGNSLGIWHSLAVASAKRHMCDKDDFNYPPAASTWHVLADDVMKFSGHHSIPSRVCAALQELAARYKPELAAPPMKAEASRILAGDQDDAPAEHQTAQQDAPVGNTSHPSQAAPAMGSEKSEAVEDRQRRRSARLRELGATFKPYGDGWRAEGVRGALATLVSEEKAAGRPKSDKSDIRRDLQAAHERERQGIVQSIG